MKIMIALILLSLSLVTFAKGSAVYVKGDVKVDHKKIKKGFIVKEGQTILTGSKSFAVFKLKEGSTFKVSPNSSLKITKVKEKKETVLTLLKGHSFFKYNKKKKGGLKVNTKTVAMGVRGTEFFVSYHKDDVWMCVHEGVVAIKSKREKKVKLVKEGEGVVVHGGQKTSTPKPYPWTRKLNWNLDPQKGSLESKINIEQAYSNPLDQEYD